MAGVPMVPPNGSRFCCGAPLDSNTDGLNPTAPAAASAGYATAARTADISDASPQRTPAWRAP